MFLLKVQTLYVLRISCVVLLQAYHKSVKIIFVPAGEKNQKAWKILKTELLIAEKDIIFQILGICKKINSLMF